MLYFSHYSAKKWLYSPELPFNIVRVHHPEGHPVHTHEFFEAAYVLKGRAMHIVNGKRSPISKGSMFLLNPEESHGYEVSTGYGIEIINLFIMPSVFNDSECLKPFYNPLRHSLHLEGIENIKIQELLDIMLNEFVHKRWGYRQIIVAHLVELLVTINRIFEQQEREESLGGLSDLKKQAIRSAIRYIESNYKEPFRLNDIAQRARLSPNYFCEVFRKLMKKTVIEYRNEMRIREACHMIRASSCNITSLCFEMGFNDLTHFERVFKKHTGLSPRDYRKQLDFS